MKSADEARKETEKSILQVDNDAVEKEFNVVEQKIEIAISCKEFCTIHKLNQKDPVHQAVISKLKDLGFKVFSVNLPVNDGQYMFIGWLEGKRR